MDARSLHTRMHARSQLAVAGADGQRAARALRWMLLQGFHHLQESGGDAVVGPWAGLQTDLMGMVLHAVAAAFLAGVATCDWRRWVRRL
jgi:hypothetical protein